MNEREPRFHVIVMFVNQCVRVVQCTCGAVYVWCSVRVVQCTCGAVYVWCSVRVVQCTCGAVSYGKHIVNEREPRFHVIVMFVNQCVRVVQCTCGAVYVWCSVRVVQCTCGAVYVWCSVRVVQCTCGAVSYGKHIVNEREPRFHVIVMFVNQFSVCLRPERYL